MTSVKYCQQCGRLIAKEQECDYFSYIRLKYCRSCAADVHRMQIAASMRRARAAARERRELERIQTEQTATENKLLRSVVKEQAARINDLQSILTALQKGK